MKRVKRLIKKYNRVIKYLIIGGLTTLVSLLTKYLLLFTIFNPEKALELQITTIISWVVAVTFAYVTNRIIVFNSKNEKIHLEALSFFTSRIFTLLLEMFVLWFFITLLKLNSKLYVIIFTVISQIIVIIANYIISKRVVFKNSFTHKA